MREATLAASLFIDFLGYLERQGHRVPDVCRAAALDPGLCDEPNSRLPASSMERLWGAALLEVFEGDARRRMEQLEPRGGVSDRVLRLLGRRLRGEVPPLALVASELAMSERSIQRGLREEETSYRQLVDEVRKDLALQHLARLGTSATDVAFLLGFSEPSAFTRAFRRWTGSSPTQFRSA